MRKTMRTKKRTTWIRSGEGERARWVMEGVGVNFLNWCRAVRETGTVSWQERREEQRWRQEFAQ
jgi:hypothetical protein